MKLRRTSNRIRGLTLIEVLVVVFVLAVLVAMLFPAKSSPRKAIRIYCLNNLKQIGLSYALWAGDHGDKYPMQVSINDTNGGGTLELASGNNAWINFAVMSNQLATPKILYCPADNDRVVATNFTTDFNNSKISYFVGLDADPTRPQMILSGDDNFAIGGVPVQTGLLEFTTNTPITWTTARHKSAGNIGLADGSVQQVPNTGLQKLIQQTGVATNRLAIP
jgi:prepilin-type N-terminal cleavage/methylation domain-containing protein/prepilin-type processing-associated H-X9-DG protein